MRNEIKRDDMAHIGWRCEICLACGALHMVGADRRKSIGTSPVARCLSVGHDRMPCDGRLMEMQPTAVTALLELFGVSKFDDTDPSEETE